MSRKGNNRPVKRSSRGKKKVQRAVPAVREIRPADRLLRDARRVAGDVDAMDAEQWASRWLGQVWRDAGLTERKPEQVLCAEVADLASRSPSPAGLAAVAALRRIAPEEAVALLDEAITTLGQAQPRPAWLDTGPAKPVRAWRALDVWDSRRILWVEFASPRPHTLGVWTETTRGLYVTAINGYPPDAQQAWAEHIDEPTPMPLVETPTDEVLAEIAEAMQRTDITWPRNSEELYVEWRMLVWSRCRAHLPEPTDVEWMSEERRAEVIEEFIDDADGPDHDVTRSVAELFLDYGEGYMPGLLCWSPAQVALFLSDWLPRKAILDADQRAALPGLLRQWVRFCLEKRDLEQQWIEPVVAEVDQWQLAFEEAFDDESAWGPAKQLAAELADRGVDMSDSAAVEDAMRAVNAERLAHTLIEDES